MTLLDQHRPVQSVPEPGRTWTSGACRALEHSFTVAAPHGRGFPEELEPVVTGLRAVGNGLTGRTCRYAVRQVADEHQPYTLFADEERLASGRQAVDLTPTLAWHINRSAVDRSLDQYVLLHASAAALAGVTVILPADEESGKSTTVAGLLRNGFDYITDEIVAMDPSTGEVTPFPKALSIDPGAWALFPECRPRHEPERWRTQWQVSADLLGARTVRGRAPAPRLIVFPKYVQGAITSLTPISKGEAVQELARMSFGFKGVAGRNLQLFGALVPRATVARLTIGQLDAAVVAVEQLISEQILEAL